MIKDENRGSSISEEAIIEDLGFKSGVNINNELEILKSQTLMRDVVDSLNLHIAYYSVGRIKTSEAYNISPVKLEIISPKE